jgi:hypothetical protein
MTININFNSEFFHKSNYLFSITIDADKITWNDVILESRHTVNVSIYLAFIIYGNFLCLLEACS